MCLKTNCVSYFHLRFFSSMVIFKVCTLVWDVPVSRPLQHLFSSLLPFGNCLKISGKYLKITSPVNGIAQALKAVAYPSIPGCRCSQVIFPPLLWTNSIVQVHCPNGYWETARYWKMALRYYKSDWIRSGKASEFLTMAKSADTISTKSSIISGKAVSLKKTVKKSAKAITQPFKKLKQSISSHLATRSTISRSSSAIPPSDHEADGNNPKSIADNGSAHSSSEPEVELTPEQELSASSSHSLCDVTLTMNLEVLKRTWRSPIYSFFKPDVSFQYYEGRPCHVFTCAAPKCKSHTGIICCFQDSSDKSSTANLKHHALRCFGEDVINAAIAGKQALKLSSSIFTLFAHKGKRPVKYSHCVHTNPEVW